jgi:hypothetical protein
MLRLLRSTGTARNFTGLFPIPYASVDPKNSIRLLLMIGPKHVNENENDFRTDENDFGNVTCFDIFFEKITLWYSTKKTKS